MVKAKTHNERRFLMFCEKCNAQIDEDSKFCKACGAATAEMKPLFNSKFRRLQLLLGLIGLALTAFGLMSFFSDGLLGAAGNVFFFAGIAILFLFLLLSISYGIYELSKISQARSEKEAQRDKLLQDILKKLEDNSSQNK